MNSIKPNNQTGVSKSNGEIQVTFLGQAGYLVRGKSATFLIDPYLSNHIEEARSGPEGVFVREFPPPVKPGELLEVDFIFITHDHADHCDIQTVFTIFQNNPNCRLIGPKPIIESLRNNKIPQPQLLHCKVGIYVDLNNVSFFPVPAAHYAFDVDAEGNSACVGYVISIDGVTLYHAGDTVPFPGMVESILAGNLSIDLACLPVNGRDAKREAMGIIGNMDGRQALELASAIHACVMLPMHNDLFVINRSDPDAIMDLRDSAFPDQKVIWFKPGEEIIFSK